MLSKTQAVWRHLLVRAQTEDRHWRTIADLAGELDMATSTVHRALGRPAQIGAVSVSRLGGVETLAPYKLLWLFCAERRLDRDVLVDRRLAEVSIGELEERAAAVGMVLGGFSALIAAAGRNTISDYETVVVYGDPSFGSEYDDAESRGRAIRVLVLEADPLLARYTHAGLSAVPAAQAYADVFNVSGWSSAAFIENFDAWRVVSAGERGMSA